MLEMRTPMDRQELEQLWGEVLRSPGSDSRRFDELAAAVTDVYASGDPRCRVHIKNRFDSITESTGQAFDAENFDIDMARAFVADEIGFVSWDELMNSIDNGKGYPLLFQYAIAAMWRGDFSAFDSAAGGPGSFHNYVVDWYERGLFDTEQGTLNELLSAACMLGHTKTAECLLDNGVDPYAGMRTWLAGPHWAASSGRLETVKMLLKKGIPLEIENKYGGTVLGQALWSAVNEHNDHHAEIIEDLIAAGAHVWPGTLDWWNEQAVPSAETKQRVAAILARREDNRS